MKRIKLFIIVLIGLFVINIKADMGPPVIAEHEVMVTNKSGAQCYDNNEKGYYKTKTIIPYGTILRVFDDINGSYINVISEDNDEYSCRVKYSDVSAKTQSFDLSNAEEITKVKAVILAKGGLNMRVGPSVTYSKKITVPQYAIVTLTHKSGSYWYYCNYGDKSGWITGMHGYFGYEGKEVLYSDKARDIKENWDGSGKKLGTIPANTEITDYVNIVSRGDSGYTHYVSYNGVKGYVESMYYKTDGTGKIKLVKNVEVRNLDGIVEKKLSANQELEYTMMDEYGNFYVPSKKLLLHLKSDEFEYITKTDILTKTKGYIGEGIFGEKKDEEATPTNSNPTETETKPKEEETNKSTNSGMSSKDIIIICLLGGIFLSLTAIVIIKLMNSKKKSQPASPVVPRVVNNPLPPREDVHEGAKETVTLDTAINDVKPVDNKEDNKQE